MGWGETFWKFVSEEATRIGSLGNLAQVATAIVAGIALGFAYGQLRASRSAQREATLDELNRDQNALSLQHPRFANPRLGTVDPEAHTFDGDPVLFEQYYRFVTIGLVVCDHAVRDGRSGDWKHAVNRYLEDHCQTLGSKFFERDWPEYSDELYARWSRMRERREKDGLVFSGSKLTHVTPD